jgi:3-methylfumaryl-CoA hydratase
LSDSNAQSPADLENLDQWIGKTERAQELLGPFPLQGLTALLDYDTPPWNEGELPPLAHWLYFLPVARQSEIDTDGHPKRGGFLPPVPLPRRMWAGGRLEFNNPLRVGGDTERVSTIADVKVKQGASGRLVFVVVRHELSCDGQLCVTEEQDIVYREPVAPSATAAPARKPKPLPKADVVRTMTATPVMLFRFSALTFNAHRIHYDENYTRDVEGYDERVVHGPFIATLLADLFIRSAPKQRIGKFAFRATQPLLANSPFDLCLAWTANGAKLWTQNAAGESTMNVEIDAA